MELVGLSTWKDEREKRKGGRRGKESKNKNKKSQKEINPDVMIQVAPNLKGTLKRPTNTKVTYEKYHTCFIPS